MKDSGNRSLEVPKGRLNDTMMSVDSADFGLDVGTLPAYYGLDETAWRHWCRVWGVSFEEMKARFDTPAMMNTPGIPTTRYFDAVLLPRDQVQQKDNLKAMVVFLEDLDGGKLSRLQSHLQG